MEKYITLSKTVHAPVAQVWQDWTDEKRVAQWWAPRGFINPICQVDAKAGGKIYIVMQAGDNMGPMSGIKAPMSGVFSEVVPNHLLVFKNFALDEKGGHMLEGVTVVVFEDIDGSSTKLTVHTGAAGIAPGVEQMLGGMEQGWAEQLDKLDEFASKK